MWLTYPLKEYKIGTQGMNLEWGAEAEAMEGNCILPCSLWFAWPVFLYYSGPSAQGGYPPTVGGALTSVINLENSLQTCLVMEAFFFS